VRSKIFENARAEHVLKCRVPAYKPPAAVLPRISRRMGIQS
jgi:hypothetical protein